MAIYTGKFPMRGIDTDEIVPLRVDLFKCFAAPAAQPLATNATGEECRPEARTASLRIGEGSHLQVRAGKR